MTQLSLIPSLGVVTVEVEHTYCIGEAERPMLFTVPIHARRTDVGVDLVGMPLCAIEIATGEALVTEEVRAMWAHPGFKAALSLAAWSVYCTKGTR